MRARTGRAALAAVAAMLVAAGCAGKRIENGVFHARSGYRVGLPGAAWTVVDGGRADLQLRHRGVAAGMLVNATCDDGVARRRLDVLARQLLIGLRERQVLASEPVEAYVLKDERCVYDLLYVAPTGAFDTLRADFEGVVQSFTTE